MVGQLARLGRALLLSALWSGAAACGYIPADLYAKTLHWADRFGIPRPTAVALIWIESRYCPRALGKAGEIGLGQVLPSTAQSMGVNPRLLWDPDWNLYTSMRYLRSLYDRLGSWELALKGYNAGPARAHSPPTSTEIYAWQIAYVAQFLKSKGVR
jgi:soluble lytic murein transglycosylase-like protein